MLHLEEELGKPPARILCCQVILYAPGLDL